MFVTDALKRRALRRLPSRCALRSLDCEESTKMFRCLRNSGKIPFQQRIERKNGLFISKMISIGRLLALTGSARLRVRHQVVLLLRKTSEGTRKRVRQQQCAPLDRERGGLASGSASLRLSLEDCFSCVLFLVCVCVRNSVHINF